MSLPNYLYEGMVRSDFRFGHFFRHVISEDQTNNSDDSTDLHIQIVPSLVYKIKARQVSKK
jgi:hypothetical protein